MAISDPSPLCEVKVGSGSFASTTNGVDATTSTTVTIRLASQAGVDDWLIDCLTTDETSVAATITASLTIDVDNKTATFTSPSTQGTALRFRSRVNGGFDRNGVARSTYTTTFCIYTLSAGGRRVIAADETTEGDSTFGWISAYNDIVRNEVGSVGAASQVLYNVDGSSVGGATGLTYNPTTMQTAIRWGQASGGFANIGVATIGFLGAASAVVGGIVQSAMVRNVTMINSLISGVTMVSAMLASGVTGATGMHLVAPVLHGPILGATTVFTGTDMLANGLAEYKPVSVVRVTTTTDATITTLFTWAVPDESVSNVIAEVNATPSGFGAGGSYGRAIMIRADGGIATCSALESSWNREHTASGIGFTGIAIGSGVQLGVSGLSGFLNVKGTATGRIKWGATVTISTST